MKYVNLVAHSPNHDVVMLALTGAETFEDGTEK
jgi:hypothetical protein